MSSILFDNWKASVFIKKLIVTLKYLFKRHAVAFFEQSFERSPCFTLSPQ